MKKLLLLLFFMSLFQVNAQNDNTKNINLSIKHISNKMTQGIYDNNDGTITVVEEAGSGFVSLKKLRKRAKKSIIKYTTKNNLKYKYLTETVRIMSFGVTPKVSRLYQILNTDGSVVITKSIAISKIKELKELLDMGVITQKEFEENLIKYKKVLLEN